MEVNGAGNWCCGGNLNLGLQSLNLSAEFQLSLDSIVEAENKFQGFWISVGNWEKVGGGERMDE
jgi:hypothetical protein